MSQHINPTPKQTDLTALNSKTTLTNEAVSSNMTVVSGGTTGVTIPSLSASYAKYGNLVHLTYMFWGGAIDGANNSELILNLPFPASMKTLRYYGNIGFNDTGISDLYTVITANNSNLAKQLAFAHHTSAGGEEPVTGAQMSGKTVQGDIWYLTE